MNEREQSRNNRKSQDSKPKIGWVPLSAGSENLLDQGVAPKTRVDLAPPTSTHTPQATWERDPIIPRAASGPRAAWEPATDALRKTQITPPQRAEWVRPSEQAIQPMPQVRWGAAERVPTREQIQVIVQLERGITDARKGLKEIKEAFDYKANDPEFHGRDLDIEDWSKRYGTKTDNLSEKLGRWTDTQDSHLRADARSYYTLEAELKQLETDLLAYKQAHDLV